MRLPKSSVLLKQIPDRVGTLLPDYAHPDELGGVPGLSGLILSQLTSQELSFRTSQIWQQASQIALRNIISSVGVPAGPMASSVISILGAFDPQLSTQQFLEQVSGSLVNGLLNLTEPLLEQAIDAGVGAAMDIVSAVPFVGWIVQVFWTFGKIAYKATKMDPYELEQKYPSSVFSPSVDNQMLNSVLLQLNSNDWSTLFFPPSVGKDASWKKPIYVQSLIDGGKRFVGGNQPADPCNPIGAQCLGGKVLPGGLIEDPYLGLVPGTAWLHRAIETTGTHKINEVGATLMPSAQKQATWLWKHVSRTNSPGAFTVYCDLAESFWQTYIEDLRQAIRSSSLNSEMQAKIFNLYNRQLAKGPMGKKRWSPIFGWGDGSKEIEYAPGPLMRTLRQRQLQFCDTITVAYVDKTFGAAKDPVVLAKINKRQKDLLESPAVCEVDLDNVRDELLKAEIIERRKGYNCLVVHGDSIALGGGPKPPQLPDGFASPDPGGLEPSDHTWMKYALGGAALTGLAAAGIYCRKDLQKALRRLRRQFPF